MKKSHQKPALLLLILLVGSSLLMTATGLALKYTVGRSNEQIRETLAIAVPFVLLRGDVPLQAEDEPAPYTKSDDQDMPTSTPVAPEIPMPAGGGVTEPQGEAGTETPVFAPVTEAYFDTALFIGDSRTVGLSLYGRLGKADYFADVGMSVFNLFDKTVTDQGFSNQSLRSLLKAKQYQTIYLMLGINEMGYPAASLEKKQMAVLEELKALQPNAVIILEGNLAVTQTKASKNAVFALDKIRALNEKIAAHADNKQVFYLDVNPFFADENGYLRADATSDGTHPYAAEYKNWANWLREHGVVKK